MSDGERKLADTTGKFAQVIKDGRKVPDLEWIGGRILLSTKRILLVSNGGKRTLPLSKVRSVKGSGSNQSLAKVSSYLSVRVGNDVMLISPNDSDAFESELYDALLDQSVVLVKHPAVEGGVVQDETWQKSRLKLDDDENVVDLATADGQFVGIELDDVGTVDVDEKDVLDAQRQVVEVEHTIDGTSVETHISGPGQRVSILASLFESVSGDGGADVELTEQENQVLMALYSGVSPFEIPDFVGIDVEDVEEIYHQLIEKGVLEDVRTRREVSLKARGRNIASEVISEQ
jgi:helix-turn-helix protein